MAEYLRFRAAVFALVFDEQGRVLLHQRAGTDFLPGYWDFPSGHVEDESFTAATVRELREETGLVITEQDIELVYLGINMLDQPYINAMYQVTNWSGEPKITEPHKCSGMAFYALDDLPEKLTLGVRLMAEQNFEAKPYGMRRTSLADYEKLMGEPFKLA
jgi:8-oxo-dGTP diphosphatase